MPDEENAMKLLQPLFVELQQKTTALIASFSPSEMEAIKRYFMEATVIMKEVTDSMNSKSND